MTFRHVTYLFSSQEITKSIFGELYSLYLVILDYV